MLRRPLPCLPCRYFSAGDIDRWFRRPLLGLERVLSTGSMKGQYLPGQFLHEDESRNRRSTGEGVWFRGLRLV